MKIWLTRFPVLACVQGRDGNAVSPDAVGGLWILATCIPHFLPGWVMIVSPRSSRNARHYYLYSWSPCFTPPYITRIKTNNLSSTCTPTILRCWNRTFVLSWCASLFSSSQRILFRFSVHLSIWRRQIDCFSLNHWLCTIWFLTKLIFFVPSRLLHCVRLRQS